MTAPTPASGHSLPLLLQVSRIAAFPLSTSFWILGTSAERGTCSSYPVVASKSRKRNSRAENRMAWSSQGRQYSFQENKAGISPSPPWNQTGKNQLLLSARCQIPCQAVRTRLRKRHSPTLGEITDKWENIEKGIFFNIVNVYDCLTNYSRLSGSKQ